MDPRIEAILAQQLASGLPGLAGSEARATLRLSDRLVNAFVAASLPRGGAVSAVTVSAAAGNTFDVSVTLSRPAFVPALRAHLTIERQPALPADPVLVLRLTGGAGGLMKLAGRFIGGSLPLPQGVRLDNGLVLVDIHALLAARGQSSHLAYVRELRVTTEPAVVIVQIAAAI